MNVDNRHLATVACLLLVFGGGALGYWGHTDGGSIEVRDVQFESADGTRMAGHLYVPPGVSADDPAPGVLAVHGYVNTKGVQAPFATEYARRGYVVLALDQTGHGGSAPPAFAGGFGGPAGLAYLDSLATVNDSIALTGHSMGGWAITAAAASDPDGYDATVYQGSAPGPIPGLPVPNGSAEFPRNAGIVFSDYDEFHWLMWQGSPSAPAASGTAKMQRVFGTDAPVEEGRTYGSVSDGTARRLYTPATTHPGDHISTGAVADSVDWVTRTVPGATGPPPADQVWYWKEVGTLLALIGAVAFVFPAGSLLLDRDPFARAVDAVPDPVASRDVGWYANAALAAFLPALTYFPAMVAADGSVPIVPDWLFPQQLTNAVLAWAIVNTVVIVGLVGAWHVRRRADDAGLGRTAVPGALVVVALGYAALVVADLLATGTDLLAGPTVVAGLLVAGLLGVAVRSDAGGLAPVGTGPGAGDALERYGLALDDGSTLVRAVGAALAVVAGVYGLLVVVDALFNVDFRVWFVAFRLLTAWQLRAFLAYLPVLFAFFVAAGVLLHGRLRTPETTASPRRAAVTNATVLAGGFVVLLAVQYGALFTTGSLPIPQLALYAIVGISFVPALTVAALVSTHFFHLTGRVWTGAACNALLVAWFLVGATATHATV